jgi:hypothetical protein
MVATSLAAARASAGNVQYYGGHVISHVQVVPVLWGSGVSPAVVSGAQGFYAAILNSPYLDWMGEYDTAGLVGSVDRMPGSKQHIHRGTALPIVSLVPTNVNRTISDVEIQTELLAQLAAGKLPPPQVDAEGGVDTLYMVAFPPGMTINDFSGQDICSGGCAYHWTLTAPGITTGVPYGVIPDCGAGGLCSLGSGAFDTYTGDASHELAEAITDTECGLLSGTANARPLAWADPSQPQGGEIGDLCLSNTAFVTYQGFLVQTLWSQRLGKCITNDPSLALCNGTARPCVPCTPSDCSAATPVCDPSTGACRGCTKDSECTGATPRCDAQAGTCVACLANADCTSPAAPSCDPSSHTCVATAAGDGGTPDAGGSADGSNGADAGARSGQTLGGGGCSLKPPSTPPSWRLGLLVGLLAGIGRRRRRP